MAAVWAAVVWAVAWAAWVVWAAAWGRHGRHDVIADRARRLGSAGHVPAVAFGRSDGRQFRQAVRHESADCFIEVEGVANRPEQLRLTPDERADLVAYVDGELPEAHSRLISTKLTHSATARREVEMLQKTWELLDHLPLPQATGAVLGEDDLADPPARDERPFMGAGGCSLVGAAGPRDGLLLLARCLSAGFSFTRWVWPDPTRRWFKT